MSDLNGTILGWFSVESGARKGDNLDPTMFALFINDLTMTIYSLHYGARLDIYFDLSVLLHADDAVLLISD